MAYRSSNSANGGTTSVSVTKPTGTASGDVMVYGIAWDWNTAAGSITWPSGFTQIFHIELAANHHMAAAWKAAGGSEPSTYDATLPGVDGGFTAFVAAYSGRNTPTPINTYATALDSIDNPSPISGTWPSITTTVDGCDLLAMGGSEAYGGQGGTQNWAVTGYTERVDANSGNWSSITLADTTQSTAGATGTVSGTFTFAGGGGGQILYAHIALAPLASVGSKSGTIINLYRNR